MDKNSIKNFAMRVSQSNPTELVVVTYDIILKDLSDANAAIDGGDKQSASASCRHAVRFVAELMSSLNLSVNLSLQLWSLYEYAQKCMIKASFSHNKEDIEAAAAVFRGLRSAFAEIAKQDKSKSVMQNTQSVFAGLTYSRGRLNELSYDPNQNSRGFLA